MRFRDYQSNGYSCASDEVAGGVVGVVEDEVEVGVEIDFDVTSVDDCAVFDPCWESLYLAALT